MFGNILPKIKKERSHAKKVPDTMEKVKDGQIIFSVASRADSVPVNMLPVTDIEVLGICGPHSTYPLITIKHSQTGDITHYTINTIDEKPTLEEVHEYDWNWEYWCDGWDNYTNSRLILADFLEDGTAEFGVEGDRLIYCGMNDHDAYELYAQGSLTLKVIEEFAKHLKPVLGELDGKPAFIVKGKEMS